MPVRSEDLYRDRDAARRHGGLAQLGEHLPCKQGVESSNLLVSTDREICQRAKGSVRICQRL